MNSNISSRKLVNFTLPGLRVHTLLTRAFSSFASRTLALPRSSPGLARPRPVLARSSPGPRPFLARSSPGPRPVLARSSPGLARPSPDPAHHHFKQSSRQNRQKRNLLEEATRTTETTKTTRWNVGVLSHHLKCEMKSPHLVEFSWDFVDFESKFGSTFSRD